MKAPGLVVSDKKIFENCILKTYFLTPWPTYATNWNSLNNFDRGPPRDHSCEVWSKSIKWFQRRCCLKKLLTHGRTLKDHKSSLSTMCSGELNSRFIKDNTWDHCKHDVDAELGHAEGLGQGVLAAQIRGQLDAEHLQHTLTNWDTQARQEASSQSLRHTARQEASCQSGNCGQ